MSSYSSRGFTEFSDVKLGRTFSTKFEDGLANRIAKNYSMLSVERWDRLIIFIEDAAAKQNGDSRAVVCRKFI